MCDVLQQGGASPLWFPRAELAALGPRRNVARGSCMTVQHHEWSWLCVHRGPRRVADCTDCACLGAERTRHPKVVIWPVGRGRCWFPKRRCVPRRHGCSGSTLLSHAPRERGVHLRAHVVLRLLPLAYRMFGGNRCNEVQLCSHGRRCGSQCRTWVWNRTN
jgi:hypothetical protein